MLTRMRIGLSPHLPREAGPCHILPRARPCPRLGTGKRGPHPLTSAWPLGEPSVQDQPLRTLFTPNPNNPWARVKEPPEPSQQPQERRPCSFVATHRVCCVLSAARTAPSQATERDLWGSPRKFKDAASLLPPPLPVSARLQAPESPANRGNGGRKPAGLLRHGGRYSQTVGLFTQKTPRGARAACRTQEEPRSLGKEGQVSCVPADPLPGAGEGSSETPRRRASGKLWKTPCGHTRQHRHR